MDALRTLEDRTAFHHLYSEWLLRYERVRGHAPSDPKRSFRAAVKTCLARISRDEHRGDAGSYVRANLVKIHELTVHYCG